MSDTTTDLLPLDTPARAPLLRAAAPRESTSRVIADALRPGWRATVDGRPATLSPADHGLVAVPVPAGTRIPGVPDRYGSLRLERGGALGWRGGLELEGVGAVPVDAAVEE